MSSYSFVNDFGNPVVWTLYEPDLDGWFRQLLAHDRETGILHDCTAGIETFESWQCGRLVGVSLSYAEAMVKLERAYREGQMSCWTDNLAAVTVDRQYASSDFIRLAAPKAARPSSGFSFVRLAGRLVLGLTRLSSVLLCWRA